MGKLIKKIRDGIREELLPVRMEILPELPDITEEDIIDFIYDHELDVPRERRKAVAHGIVSQTEGRYEETLHEIEQLPWHWHFWYRRGGG